MRPIISILILCSIILCKPIAAQQIWPGDVNNNGVVNVVDVLFLGVAFGSMGSERTDASTDWQAQTAPTPWTQNFPSGLNYAYADCNGDGEVDDNDIEGAIKDNFGLTHGMLLSDNYSNGQAGEVPQLRLQTDATIVGEGASVDISLSLDDGAMPITNFYGIAFTMTYKTGLLNDDDGIDFDLTEDSWLEVDESQIVDLFVDNEGQGQAALAISRTNQQSIAAQNGEIGKFSLVIEDIIVGLNIDTFWLQIDSIRLISPNFETLPVATDRVEIIVAKDPKVVNTEWEEIQASIKLFPNPTKNQFYIQSGIELNHFQLIDNLGRRIPLIGRRLDDQLYVINRPNLPPGIYWLTSQSTQGMLFRKIIFSN